jgi:hypothetical protein
VKRGNSRGAKGPCQIHAFIRSEEDRLDIRPTTEESEGLRWDQSLDKPEKKSGVVLPPKTSELRRKLGQKAKQERRSQRAYRKPAGESFYAHLQRLGLRLL